MAQAFATQRFCTLTHYVQVSGDSVLVLHVHTLPENEDGSGSTAPRPSSIGLPPPFSWLEERHMQELLVMVHEAVLTKAVQGLSDTQPSKSGSSAAAAAAGKEDLQLKRGRNLRVLFNFKPHRVSQHIALPTDPTVSPLLTSASTFMTAQGRLVFESTGFTTSGNGFQPFRAVQDTLHVFVDSHEPTSPHGVVKILMLLDPDQKQSRDVMTYFQPQQKGEGSSSEGEGGGGGLAELPVEGLKRRHRGGVASTEQGRGRGRLTRRKAGGEKKSSKAKAKAKTSERDRSALRSQPQPTIIQSLAGVSKQSAALRKHPSTKTRSSSIDEMFGMGSGWISDDDDEEDNRPPNSVGCSSGSADSPSCSTGSAVTLSYNSASVASVASESGNTALALPEVISSSSGPVSYTTPPLSTVDMCGCDVIESYSAGSQSPNIQSPVTQDIVTHLAVPLSPGLRRGSQDRVTTTQRKSLRLKNLALCKSSGSDPSSVDLQRREAKHRVQLTVASSTNSEDEDDLPTVSIKQCQSSSQLDTLQSPRDEEKEKMDTTGTDSQAPFPAISDSQRREITPEIWSAHSKTDSPDSQPLRDTTNVFEITDLPQTTKKGMDCHLQGSGNIKDSQTAPACASPSFRDETLVDQTCTVDLTGEGCSIVLSSEEDSVFTSQQSAGEGGRRAGRKRGSISPRTLFKGAKELRDVPKKCIGRWLCQSKQLLIDIFQRNVYSRRHQFFITGARQRAALQHQISAHLFSKEQVDVITEGLMKAFCYKSMDYFSYVMSVLYPECLVRLIMDFYSVTFDQAERKMMGMDEELELDSENEC